MSMREVGYHEDRALKQAWRLGEMNTKNHANYLALRKLLREYAKETGHEFPEYINKAIGLKVQK